MSYETLRKWIDLAKYGSDKSLIPANLPDAQMIRELQKENARLRMERDGLPCEGEHVRFSLHARRSTKSGNRIVIDLFANPHFFITALLCLATSSAISFGTVIVRLYCRIFHMLPSETITPLPRHRPNLSLSSSSSNAAAFSPIL